MEELANRIGERIRTGGPIPFACFMEMALYYPGLGYYASGRRRTGATGDYYTSPQAHPVFGALLALQLERLWQLLGRPPLFHVVEAGAGDGRLARDITDYSRHLEPGFCQALCYVMVDIPVAGEACEPPLRAVASRGLPFRGLVGCILSNELLDAFPVHRLSVQGSALQEVYVDLEDGAFVEAWGELSPPVRELVEMADSLPEGWCLEVRPSAWDWMGQAARALESGFVMTIDYGYTEAPHRSTLASYQRHALTNPYGEVGQQDLTAHVDLGAAMEAGRRVRLEPLALASQRRFLLDLGLGAFREAAARLRLPQGSHQANQMAMLDLVRPEGLGGLAVLIQYKGSRAIGAEDLAPGPPAQERLTQGALPVPLLGPEHVPLLEGRYPHLAWEIDGARGKVPR